MKFYQLFDLAGGVSGGRNHVFNAWRASGVAVRDLGTAIKTALFTRGFACQLASQARRSSACTARPASWMSWLGLREQRIGALGGRY
jgi:hypothetical protein